VLSAADEVAVELFLGGQIGFLDIAQLIKDSLGHHGSRKEHLSLEDILAADAGARKYAHNWRPR
jgi:1-deoxy-D-xylulose-5-phosphate reductoisomerase